jgi:hypothetical protein
LHQVTKLSLVLGASGREVANILVFAPRFTWLTLAHHCSHRTKSLAFGSINSQTCFMKQRKAASVPVQVKVCLHRAIYSSMVACEVRPCAVRSSSTVHKADGILALIHIFSAVAKSIKGLGKQAGLP